MTFEQAVAWIKENTCYVVRKDDGSFEVVAHSDEEEVGRGTFLYEEVRGTGDTLEQAVFAASEGMEACRVKLQAFQDTAQALLKACGAACAHLPSKQRVALVEAAAAFKVAGGL